MLTQHFDPVREAGVTELIGKDEKVDQNDYSGSVGVTLANGGGSGKILGVALYSTEEGTGTVLTQAGKLLVLDADPAVASGDVALTVAEFKTVIAAVDIAAADWVGGVTDGGAVAIWADHDIPFHDLSALHFTFKNEGATAINSDAADDEYLHFNFWYQLESE